MASKKKIYLSFIILFLAFYALGIFFFVFAMGTQTETPEGNFITPGNASMEWTLAILTIPLIVLVTGIIAIYGFSHLFLKAYIKSLGRNAEIGFVPLEELSNSQLWRKIWIRSIILGFFMMNICFTLASQEFMVYFMRSPRLDAEYTIPDPETMWHLVWLLSIPCTLILVPIWLMIDSGVVASKKSRV